MTTGTKLEPARTAAKANDLPQPAATTQTSTQHKSSLFATVIRQFDKACDLIDLDSNMRKILAKPTNEITVNFPVKMDDGRVEVFTGYRVQHNSSRGPFKGGLRFHPSVDIDEVRTM